MRSAEWQRAYHSQERVEWVKRRRCDVCGRYPTWHEQNENAHVTTGGTGRKADYQLIITACPPCHHAIDSGEGKRAVERHTGKDLRELAAGVETEWQDHQREMV